MEVGGSWNQPPYLVEIVSETMQRVSVLFFVGLAALTSSTLRVGWERSLFSSIDVGLHTFQRVACCSPCLYYLRMADIPASAGVGGTWCRKILNHES